MGSLPRQIRLGSPSVTHIDRVRVMEVFDSKQFSPGRFCREFETKFAKLVNRPYALFLNSGTDALRIALLALKEKFRWPDWSLVAVPAITFPATLNVVLQANLTPYLVDVSRTDYTLDVGHLDDLTASHAFVAILPVHIFGTLCDMDKVMAFSRRHHLRVLEDSCECVGLGAGSWGDAAAFSTYQCHHIQTGVGGIAVTGDEDLHEMMRSYANHGRDTHYIPGYRTPEVSPTLLKRRFRFERVGYSARATEFQAALGLGQLERLSESLYQRRRRADQLTEALARFEDDLVLPRFPRSSYMMYPLVCRMGSKVSKLDLVWSLEKAGIETRDMMPITNQPVFKDYVLGSYPVADWINSHGFYLPIHPEMSDQDISYIVDTITSSLDREADDTVLM